MTKSSQYRVSRLHRLDPPPRFKWFDPVLGRTFVASSPMELTNFLNSQSIVLWRKSRTAKVERDKDLNARHGARLMLEAVKKRRVKNWMRRFNTALGGYHYGVFSRPRNYPHQQLPTKEMLAA